MTEKRKVRPGLLNVGLAILSGEEWEFEGPSEHYIPGMGVGASEQATRWAWMGYNLEKRLLIEGLAKKRRGRPTKSPIETKDAYRAFMCWGMTRLYKPEQRRTLTNRQLIELLRKSDEQHKVPKSERIFPSGNFEASVSRGKTILGIDEDWNSALCEEIVRK